MKNEIAKMEFFSISSNGEDKPLVVRIGAPDKRNEDEWQCPWEINGLYEENHSTVSNESWHCLLLAIQTIEQLLSYYVEDGGKLYWEKGGNELQISELIPRWSASNKSPQSDA